MRGIVGWPGVSPLAVLLLITTASAEDWSFTLSGGYSRLRTDATRQIQLHVGPSSSFYGIEGEYLEAAVSRNYRELAIPLELSIATSWTGHFADRGVMTDNPSGGFEPTGFTTLHSQLNIATFEARCGVPLFLHGSTGPFINPQLGAGLLYEHSKVDASFVNIGGTYFGTDGHTGMGFEVRPAFQLGYATTRFAAGGEISYMAAVGDFGVFGRSATELRAGVFLSYRF